VFKRFKSLFRGVQLRAESSRMGFMPNFKKTEKMGCDLVHGSDAFSVGVDSKRLGLSATTSLVDTDGSSPAPEALGCSSVDILAYSVHASFFHQR
jgi:hypothetical protein